MECTNEHGNTIVVEKNQATELLYSNKRCTELEGLLSTARSASDANNNKAMGLSAQRQAFEDMIQPLISYIGEQLLDSSSFNKDIERMVADKLGDFTNDRDFANAVEEIVNGLNFQISVS